MSVDSTANVSSTPMPITRLMRKLLPVLNLGEESTKREKAVLPINKARLLQVESI